MSIPSTSGSGGGIPKGISLTNTVHCELATCLPLPCLPVFCGALDEDLRLFEQQSSSRMFANSSDVAGKIADLLRNTDVSYLNLKNEASAQPCGSVGNFNLYDEVLRCDPVAFEYIAPVSQVLLRSRYRVVIWVNQSLLSKAWLCLIKCGETL